jgi:hypothetical protein
MDAKRQGDEVDNPEGARYITLSDTLARRMVDAINHHLGAEE